ncbi:hypothetical protein MLE29_10805, partial [Pasteurella multocida]|uniref:hypothetical protein n=1 Tax=Pasteurella multocida TaxID=747 RepID=UPI001F0D33CD
KMGEVLKVSLELSNNALDIVNGFSDAFKSFDLNANTNRRLLSEDGFPSWVSEGQRRLIQVGGKRLKPDVVVAQDGSGKFKTLGDALKAVPPN